MIGVLLLAMVGQGHAVRPSDLAPGAPELQEAEQRLVSLLAEADAVRAATSRLQARWVFLGQQVVLVDGSAKPGSKPLPSPKVDPCAAERVDIGWRIERFGAAWREAAQAVHAEAGRVDTMRAAATVAPLVDSVWAGRLKAALDQDALGGRAFVEASVWQARFIRPMLAECAGKTQVPLPSGADAGPQEGLIDAGTPDDRVDESASAPSNGEALAFVWAGGHVNPPVAVLAAGDGWICPGAVRADDAIVLLPAARDGSAAACWSASSSCSCTAEPVWPGGVVAGPVSD